MTRFWDNTETWTTKAGETIRLEDLEPSHRENVLRWIYRHGEKIRFQAVLAHCADEAYAWENMGEAAHDSVVAIGDWMQDAPLDEFLESLPIVQRLRELSVAVPALA